MLEASAPKLAFTDVLNAHILRNRYISNRTGPQPAWYASGLGTCERKATLRRAGVKGTPFDVRTLRKFWMGDKVHHELQNAVETELRANPNIIFLGHELSVRNDEYHIAGRLDSLVSVDGVVEAWEYKTTASGAFKYGDLPKKEHRLQLGVYLTFPCKLPGGGGEDSATEVLPQRGRLIYWSKDDALIDEYIVDANEQLKEQVKATLTNLEGHYQRYAADKTLPPVIDLEQAMKKNKATGKYDLPFVYEKATKNKKTGEIIPKGTKKMIHNFQCLSKNGTNPCEYYGNACPLTAWGLTTGPDAGDDAPEEEE